MVSSARDITFSVDEGIQNRPNRKWQYLVVTVVIRGKGEERSNDGGGGGI